MSPHILIAEDSEDDLFLAKRVLFKAGLNSIFHASDGELARDYLLGRGEFGDRSRFPLPQIILLDIKLPKINGLQLLEWIITQDFLSQCAVYILSSSGEARDVARAKASNIKCYFIKPLRAEDISSLVYSGKGPNTHKSSAN